MSQITLSFASQVTTLEPPVQYTTLSPPRSLLTKAFVIALKTIYLSQTSKNILNDLEGDYSKKSGNAYTKEIVEGIESFEEIIPLITNGSIDLSLAALRCMSESQKEVFQKVAEDFETAVGEIKGQLIQVMLKNKRLTPKWEFKKNDKLYRIPFFLNSYMQICTCTPNVSRKKRIEFAQTLLSITSKVFKNKTRLKLCSLGSGKCYQEFFTYLLFRNQGFEIDWSLVDPALNNPFSNASKATTEFTNLVKFLSNGDSKVEVLALTCDEFAEHIKQLDIEQLPDITYAVDLEAQLPADFQFERDTNGGVNIAPAVVNVYPVVKVLSDTASPTHIHIFAELHKYSIPELNKRYLFGAKFTSATA